jgi:hypothetical protein
MICTPEVSVLFYVLAFVLGILFGLRLRAKPPAQPDQGE